LIERVRSIAPAARYIDSYREVRPHLGDIWEVETSISTEIPRMGFGSSKRTKTITTTNLVQFTKFSRLQSVAYER
jgi:hypothetical protein